MVMLKFTVEYLCILNSGLFLIGNTLFTNHTISSYCTSLINEFSNLGWIAYKNVKQLFRPTLIIRRFYNDVVGEHRQVSWRLCRRKVKIEDATGDVVTTTVRWWPSPVKVEKVHPPSCHPWSLEHHRNLNPLSLTGQTTYASRGKEASQPEPSLGATASVKPESASENPEWHYGMPTVHRLTQ